MNRMTMRYGRSLYQDNDIYTVHKYTGREEWLKGRNGLHGIGGSDASAACGENPWRTNLDLWMIKTGKKDAPDISDSDRVQYGISAEEYIRRLFQLKNKGRYTVEYLPDVVLQSKQMDWCLYSPDGLLIEKKTGLRGILEIKTSTIMKSIDKEKWGTRERPCIPQNYYDQVLHGLITTGFQFVELYAELTYDDTYSNLRKYTIRTTDDGVPEDMARISSAEKKFMECVNDNKEPALILPEI